MAASPTHARACCWQDGWTALIFASRYNHVDVVKVLLAHEGTDANLQNYVSDAPLAPTAAAAVASCAVARTLGRRR